MPDIPAEERIVDVAFLPLLTVSLLAVTTWKSVVDVEPAEDLVKIFRPSPISFTRVSVITASNRYISVLLHESLAPKIASRHSDCELSVVSHSPNLFI